MNAQIPLDWNGTSLVLPGETRFDSANNHILAGKAREFVGKIFAKHDCSIDACRIVYANDPRLSILTEGSKHLILTGQATLDACRDSIPLDVYRGFLHTITGTKCVATYDPQSCMDLVGIESYGDSDDDEDSEGSGKDSAPTKRANYRGWFRQDIRKVFDGAWQEPDPDAKLLLLDENRDYPYIHAKGQTIFFDLEASPQTQMLWCFTLAFNRDGPLLTVPVYDWTRKRRYSNQFYVALNRLLCSNKIVIHNAGFDLAFMFFYYRIMFGNDVYDTMLAQHRMFRELEKSLAHSINLFTNAPYHKGTGGTFNPTTEGEYWRLLKYNQLDVNRLRSVYYGQQRYIMESGDAGLVRSVNQVNSSFCNYLIAGLRGLDVDSHKQRNLVVLYGKQLKILQRLLNILVGYNLNVGSAPQVIKYVHGEMRYAVQKTTKTGTPSVGGDALYALAVAYPLNPALRVMIKIRTITKKLSMASFKTILE